MVVADPSNHRHPRRRPGCRSDMECPNRRRGSTWRCAGPRLGSAGSRARRSTPCGGGRARDGLACRRGRRRRHPGPWRGGSLGPSRLAGR